MFVSLLLKTAFIETLSTFLITIGLSTMCFPGKKMNMMLDFM